MEGSKPFTLNSLDKCPKCHHRCLFIVMPNFLKSLAPPYYIYEAKCLVCGALFDCNGAKRLAPFIPSLIFAILGTILPKTYMSRWFYLAGFFALFYTFWGILTVRYLRLSDPNISLRKENLN